MDEQKKWLIWSFEHVGWWKKAERGYTDEIEEAGIYPFGQAMDIVIEANKYGKIKEAMLPLPVWK
jgi:hypothetical protein